MSVSDLSETDETKVEDEEGDEQGILESQMEQVGAPSNQKIASVTPSSRVKGYECIREGCGNMVYCVVGQEDYFMCSTRCKLVMYPDSTSRLIRNLQDQLANKEAKLNSLKGSTTAQLEKMKKKSATEMENLKKESATEIENLKKANAAMEAELNKKKAELVTGNGQQRMWQQLSSISTNQVVVATQQQLNNRQTTIPQPQEQFIINSLQFKP